jgi:Ca-activated chloride channel family protein
MRGRFRRVPVASICSLMMLLSTANARARLQELRTQSGEEATDKPEYSISVETALVSMDVVVTDQDGNVLTELKRGNFRILDEGKPQIVATFAAAEEPITIVMLIEYSARAYNYFAYKAVNWGMTFLDHLDAKDWVALVTYDMKPTVQVDFTHNRSNIQQTLSKMSFPAFQESNMFDALFDTLERLQKVKGKKSILLITTGSNTFSRHSIEELQKRLKQSDVTLFCVGVAESEYQMAEARGEIAGSEHLAYLQAKNQLQHFAKLTGGHSWFPRFEGEIPGIFRSVAIFLRNQYRLGFSPPNLVYDGKYHKLKVEIIAPDGSPLKVTNEKGERRKIVVYAREGYTAPERSRIK